jgi:hypothetical protein
MLLKAPVSLSLSLSLSDTGAFFFVLIASISAFGPEEQL